MVAQARARAARGPTRVERTADGAIKRTVTDGEGATTITLVGTDGVITVTHPDGTIATQEVRARPALRHAGADDHADDVTTPGGARTTSRARARVDLAKPGAC